MSTNPTLSRDARLRIYLLQIAQGDEHAMAGFYKETARIAGSYCYQLMRSPAEVDDVLSDVYLQVWRKAHTYDADKGSPISWISTIVRSRALDRLRQNRVRNEREEPASSASPIDTLRCPRPNPEEQEAESQRASRMREVLQFLDGQDRQLLELAYWSGLSQTEIAERLDWPLGTVKSRMRRALLRLRELMYNEASQHHEDAPSFTTPTPAKRGGGSANGCGKRSKSPR